MTRFVRAGVVLLLSAAIASNVLVLPAQAQGPFLAWEGRALATVASKCGQWLWSKALEKLKAAGTTVGEDLTKQIITGPIKLMLKNQILVLKAKAPESCRGLLTYLEGKLDNEQLTMADYQKLVRETMVQIQVTLAGNSRDIAELQKVTEELNSRLIVVEKAVDQHGQDIERLNKEIAELRRKQEEEAARTAKVLLELQKAQQAMNKEQKVYYVRRYIKDVEQTKTNLRVGPGVFYDPPITALPPDTPVRIIGYAPSDDATVSVWARVAVKKAPGIIPDPPGALLEMATTGVESGYYVGWIAASRVAAAIDPARPAAPAVPQPPPRAIAVAPPTRVAPNAPPPAAPAPRDSVGGFRQPRAREGNSYETPPTLEDRIRNHLKDTPLSIFL